MRTSLPPVHRTVALGAGLMLAAALLAGCGAAAPDPAPTATEGQQAVIYPEIREAVTAADPRVQDIGITDSQSGASRVLTVGVAISGVEPVTTASLTAILVAIRDNLPEGIDQVDLMIREDESNDVIDISAAVAGLPAGITPLYDGVLTMMRDDLDAL